MCLFVLVSFRGETALHKAATSCQRSICKYLVEAGASLMKTDLQVKQEIPRVHASIECVASAR